MSIEYQLGKSLLCLNWAVKIPNEDLILLQYRLIIYLIQYGDGEPTSVSTERSAGVL